MSSAANANETEPVIIVANSVTALGPYFFGNTINWLLLGSLCMQVYTYACNFPRDKLYIKIFVYTLFIFDLLQTALSTHSAWWFMIEHWGNASVLQSFPVTAISIPMGSGFISTPVQLFYSVRIWILSRSSVTRVIAILIAVLGLAQGLTVIVASAMMEGNLNQEELLRLHPYFTFWLAAAFTTDVMIACCMVWILQTVKSKSKITQTDSLLNKLILSSVQTGSVTVVAAAVDLALLVEYTDTNYHLAFGYILGKLYTNSFMANMNMRAPRLSAEPPESIGMRIHYADPLLAPALINALSQATDMNSNMSTPEAAYNTSA
ncbi:hypothetical protein DFH06DRAFT_1475918 [Mycena polygramma]|nr:hypothetical protein DFH06DRAFT_1475918 [Mycena polygramma]